MLLSLFLLPICTPLLFPPPIECGQGGTVLAITNGVVFPANGSAPIQDGVVVIRGNRIEAVGEASEVWIPSGATVLDAGGGTVMPGLINAHVHHGGPPEERARFLAEGVTTVCDLGGRWEEIAGYREAQFEGGPVARGFFAGQFLTPPGGYPDGPYGIDGYNMEVVGVEAVRQGVQALADSGVHFIKVALDPGWNEENPTPYFSPEEARALVDEAARHGLRVRSHMIRYPSFPQAVEAGVQIAEHMPFPDGWPPEEKIEELMLGDDPLAYFFDEWHPQYDTLLSGLVDAGMVMVPTVAALMGDNYRKEDATPRERFVVAAILDIVRKFRDKGGVIALGNDFNGRGGQERFPATEIQALMDAGLTPAEIMEVGTRYAAWTCGQEESLGTLEAGKLADLLILERDFLEDPTAITRIRWVVLDGMVQVPVVSEGV
jgi:imidazolonepropionase-like amidohydrolase